MPVSQRGKGASLVETIDWKDGEYNASHHASDVGVKIRHVFNRKKRIWEGYKVWTGRTTGWWQWPIREAAPQGVASLIQAAAP
jgi:hypothetical protein